jgi:hypothetical protein
MRTRITHHERSICEFIADPVHHAAHTLAIVAIGSHGHLRFDALLYPAEGNVVKAAGQYDLQVCALLAPDLRPAVGKLNAAARIRIAQGKAAVGKGALVDQSHLGADHRAIDRVQRVLHHRKHKLDRPNGHHRGKDHQENGTTGHGYCPISTGPERPWPVLSFLVQLAQPFFRASCAIMLFHLLIRGK